MKKILLLGLLLIVGIVAAPYGSNEKGSSMVIDVGESVGAAGQGEPVREQERIQEQAQVGKDNAQGISAQVHQIIQYRKNDTLDVPQGQVVRIIAQNHSIEVDSESIPLNATLKVRLRVQERDRVLAFNSSDDEDVEIEENGTRVRTRETIRIQNREFLAGDANVTVLPADIPEKLRLKKMDHVRLTVENGNPYYDINGTKVGKLLWLFDVELPIQARIHAQSGAVERQQGPWWAFLVTS
ncbi:MAG: hypothetical protein QXT45_02680 [Candidatus Bilamarchaeaceae archaeon]